MRPLRIEMYSTESNINVTCSLYVHLNLGSHRFQFIVIHAQCLSFVSRALLKTHYSKNSKNRQNYSITVIEIIRFL